MTPKLKKIFLQLFSRLKVLIQKNKFVAIILIATICFFVFSKLIQQQDKVAIDTQPINHSQDETIMLQTIEDLKDSVATLNQQIAKIDSLRIENARTGGNQSLNEHYSELSRRYANKKAN